MSNPVHHPACVCFPCHTQRNPRALAPDYAFALGEDSVLHRVPLAPEPLYPRAPEVAQGQQERDRLVAELLVARLRIGELEAALDSIARNSCCESCREAGLVAASVLKGVR